MRRHADSARSRRTRPLVRASLVVLAMACAASASNRANCPSAPILHGLTSSFEQCGPDAQAFFWGHGRAVQRIIASEATGANATAAGHDSGRLSTVADAILIDGPGGAASGSYLGNTDGADTGSDGCFLNASLVDTGNIGCGGAIDFGVVDYVIGGMVGSEARMAAVSVDFNQFFQQHVLDHAGAPAVDGDNCNADAFSGFPGPVNCTTIPVPQILSSSHITSGVNVMLRFGSTAAIPILDDCNIAESRAVNCPRNLVAGRVLVFRHGSCSSGAAPTERRTFSMPALLPASGTMNVFPNWTTFSREDLNLNGILDAGEDGANGGAVDGRLDPTIVAGTAQQDLPIFVPAVAGATDCIYLGMAVGLDNNRKFVNPPTNTIVGEMVLSPVVSMNPTPVQAGAATPVSDQVIDLRAGRTGGKASVDWSTGAELTTSGFNVIGTKKGGGGEVKLNDSLIAAKEGTTGRGATYTLVLDMRQLKGSTSVYVEIVKNDGSRERFGPASL